MTKPPIIIVHGGAWNFPDDTDAAHSTGCRNAAAVGARVLAAGGSALDAVEAAVRALEDDLTFGAGHGSVLNEDGDTEMDACIVDGTTLGAGAVAAVGNIANPVSLARRVMEKTPHVLLVGSGAQAFARSEGVAHVPTDELVTAVVRQQFAEFKAKYPNAVLNQFNRGNPGHDTVGAVALDRCGRLAAATSTGGITNKMRGRVGDSPIVGCGAIADNSLGAVSTTGHGESIIKVCLASRVVSLLGVAIDPMIAAHDALDYMTARVGGHGGAVGISAAGVPFAAHSTEKMAWAVQRVGVDAAPSGGIVAPPRGAGSLLQDDGRGPSHARL